MSTRTRGAVPYLTGEPRRAFDRWLAAELAAWMPPLTFQEVRKGVRAISSLYLERRAAGPIGPRLAAGRGKRAAFATYYAALHFLTAFHAVGRLGAGRFGEVQRLHDLGCGTGAAGAAVTLALGSAPGGDRGDPPAGPVRTAQTSHPSVLASDPAGWALREARSTYAAFGVPARTRRAALPGAMPRGARGELLVLGWVANEVSERARSELLPALQGALRRGSRLLLLEPLAGAVSPWWPSWSSALAEQSVRDVELKIEVELPEWIARMDRAAGLDHRTLGARVFAGPLETGRTR